MIPVTRQDEPRTFQKDVREPGQKFLANCPKPTTMQFLSRSYWSKCSGQLYAAYGKICCYTCHFIPCDTGACQVEHFKAKSKYPQDAYEWNNYRLVCGRMNGRKGAYEDVLDPFEVEAGWFVISFPDMIIHPGEKLAQHIEDKVIATITRLRLNEEDASIQGRLHWLMEYCRVAEASEQVAFDQLQRTAPLIAAELERQDLRGAKIRQRLNPFIVVRRR